MPELCIGGRFDPPESTVVHMPETAVHEDDFFSLYIPGTMCAEVGAHRIGNCGAGLIRGGKSRMEQTGKYSNLAYL